MQIVVERLDRPWGLDRQAILLARWLLGEGRTARLVARGEPEALPEELRDHVVTSPRPWRVLDPDQPTLAGPFPAAGWVQRAGVRRYDLVLSHLPWGLYPSRQRRWLGRLPVYYRRRRDLLWRSLRYLATYPLRRVRRAWKRRRDQRAVAGARRLLLWDARLREPVRELYDREGEVTLPVVPLGHGGVRDPGKFFLAVAPLEPVQNLRRVIDAFYLFVHRLGARHRNDWERAQPLRMWEPGDVELRILGEGSGEAYLRDYIRSQQLSDRVSLEGWASPAERDRALGKALAVVDVPLAGSPSTLPYHALARGVPAVYSPWHPRVENILGDDPRARHVEAADTSAVARALLSASRIPATKRTPIRPLREALEPAAAIRELLEGPTSPA